jgi:hypothetical protein
VSESNLYNQGLERFAMGDLAGAARLWLAALVESPDHPQLRAYLDHVRAVQPALVASIEAEAGLAGPGAAPAGGATARTPQAPLSIPEYAAGATPAPPALAPIPVAVTLLRGSSRARPAGAPTAGASTPAAPTRAAPAATATAAPATAATTTAATGPAAPGVPANPAPVAPSPLTRSGFVIPAPPPVARPSATKGQPAPASAPAAAADDTDPWRDEESPGAPMQVSSPGPALSIVEATRGPTDARRIDLGPMLERLRTLVSLDNFTGPLELARQILRHVPDHPEAKSAHARSQSRLSTMYGSRIGRLDAVPRVRVQPREVIWLDLDHRAGFVLSQVDGQSTFEEILELTGMERLETMRILADLVGKGIIDASR